jgi:hypothetical protein
VNGERVPSWVLLLALELVLAATILAGCGGGDDCELHELPPPTQGAPAPVLVECER